MLTGGPWPDDRRHDDPQHGAAAPVDPRRAAHHDGARRRDRAPRQAGDRLPPHRAWRRRARSSPTCRARTNVTRMDYASPLSNELVFSMAVERLLDLELPERATWIRMLLVELNRMSSHLLFQATNGMDLGAVSMMIYGWRERELTLRLLETHHRPADEPQLHPPRRRRRRPPRRLGARRPRALRPGRARRRRVRHAAHREPDLARAHRRRRRDRHRRRRWRSAPPARSCARPGSRGTCARRSRTSRTTTSTST